MVCPPSLTAAGISALDKLLEGSVGSRQVPATFFGLTNSKEIIYWNSNGPVDFDHPDGPAVDENTVLQQFSATKLVTTVAALQLVDRGLVSLDDTALIETHLPELATLRILRGYDEKDEPEWEDPTTKITLRMLLSHTSGLSYVNRSPILTKWAERQGVDTQYLDRGATEASFLYPLLFNPGSAWVYGVGLDWVGILISRLTGKSLEDHYKEEIFDKAGMKSATFYPTDETKQRLMRLTVQESADSPIKASPDNFAELGPLTRESDPEKAGPVLSGGAGLFSTAKDYLAFLRAILASRSGDDKTTILSRESFEELFKDSLQSDGDHDHMFDTLKSHTFHDPSFFELAPSEPRKISQSVGLAINFVDSIYGRKAGSGGWDGVARTMYWLDPKTGLAGICMTNILCPVPHEFYRLYNRFERTVYDGLSDDIDEPMPDSSRLAPDHRFLFKPLEDTQGGGCNASVWLPKTVGRSSSRGLPIALFYHGGAWALGSSLQIPYYQARYLLDKEIVVVSFDHRLIPHVALKEIQEDLLDSYKYVQQGLNRDLAAAGSGIVVDGSRAAAFGWSAGASNSVYLASAIELHNERSNQASELPALKAIIPTYPLISFDVLNESRSTFDEAAKASSLLARSVQRIDEQQCSTSYEMPDEYWPRIIEISSGNEGAETEMDRENPRCIWAFKNKSICSFLAGTDRPYSELAEPINLISRNFPPTCVVSATEDGLIPTEQFGRLYDRVKELGIDALLVECQGMRHAEAEKLPLSPEWPQGNTWWKDALLPSLVFALQRMTGDQ